MTNIHRKSIAILLRVISLWNLFASLIKVGFPSTGSGCAVAVKTFHVHTALLKPSCQNAFLLVEKNGIFYQDRTILYINVLLNPSCQNALPRSQVTLLLFMFTRRCCWLLKLFCQNAFLQVEENMTFTARNILDF